jgi:acetyl-CoA acyltransferase
MRKLFYVNSQLTQNCSHPALRNKPMMRVEGACASGGLAMSCGVDAIRAGADVVLVAGVEVQTTADSRTGADFLARASHYAAQRSIHDFLFPALFARRSAAYKRKYGATDEDIGRAAVKAYANAARNPLAHMRSKTISLAAATSPSDSNPLFLNGFEDSGHMKVDILQLRFWVFATTSSMMLLCLPLASS